MNISNQTSDQFLCNNDKLQLIIEALLFTSSVDIIGEWTEEQRNNMIDIAISLKSNIKKFKNIKLFKHTQYPFESQSTERVIENFNHQIEIEESNIEYTQ